MAFLFGKAASSHVTASPLRATADLPIWIWRAETPANDANNLACPAVALFR
jgi:hypothetical protein